MLRRALTAAARNDAARSVIVPRWTRSSRVTRRSRWRRITTDGRGVTHAAAARRAPPSRRRCSRGWAWENGRALTSLREARKTRKSMSSWSVSATAGPGTRRPSVSSRVTWSWPVMMMFSTVSSSTNGCSRPRPNRALSTAAAIAACSAGDQVGVPASMRSAASPSRSSRMMARPRSRCASAVRCPRSSPSAALSRSEACCRNAATRPQSRSPAYGRGSARGTTTGSCRGVGGVMVNPPRTLPGRATGGGANRGSAAGSAWPLVWLPLIRPSHRQ